MFRPTDFAEVAPTPLGQVIHVASVPPSIRTRCDEWIVLDEEIAWAPRYGKVTMNWPANSNSVNLHWEWECEAS